MKTLHLDYETRSDVDLRKTGITPYVESQNTDVNCAAFAFGDGQVELWKRGEAIPSIIIKHVKDGGLVAAHNASFELAIWNGIWVPRLGLPVLKPEQVYCTMAKAFAMGLPGALANVAPALGLKQRKDDKGSRIMLQLARPKKILQDGTPVFMEEFEYPEKFDALYEYCKQDVVVEREVDTRLMDLSKSEQKLWVLDQKINNRGIQIDVKACKAALSLVKNDKKKLDDKMKEVTENFVSFCSEVSRLKTWLLSQGIDCKGVAKDDVKAMLSLPNLPTNVKSALRLRQLAGKTSTAKLDSMLKRVGKNGRVLQTLQYHGANTGRWAARGVQFQNVPRPVISQDNIEQIFEWLLTKNMEEAAELIEVFYGDVTTAISSCLRGMVIGENLICGDWSAIEARVLAWLAGQESILKVFRGNGKIYEKEAAGIYGIGIDDVDKEQRQVGKVACIAEGQMVLTDKGLVPIEKVAVDARVWDGMDWVEHEGVVFKGVKKVYEYQGLVATEDHIVFTEEYGEICFRDAAEKQGTIVSTGIERKEIRLGEGFKRKIALERYWRRQTRIQKINERDTRPMCRMQDSKMDRLSELNQGENFGLPKMLSAKESSKMVIKASSGHEGKVFKCAESSVRELRWSGNTVQFQKCIGGCLVDSEEFRASSRFSNRQNRQRRKLRSGEFKIRLLKNSKHEQTNERVKRCSDGFGTFKSVQSAHHAENVTGTENLRPNNRVRTRSREEEEKELEWHKRKVGESRVYDIVNAGPRNRFTVSNKLVHNCLSLGYQGGKRAFQAMAKNYSVKVTDERAEEIKERWRGNNQRIVAYWSKVERASILAVENPGRKYQVGVCTFLKNGSFLWCQLPSKRVICYPYPELKLIETPWGAEKTAMTYMGTDAVTKKWVRKNSYGGLVTENITQAVARDVLSECITRLEEKGYPVVMHVHDEIVCEHKDPDLEFFENEMKRVPTWAKGLPLDAEGWIGHRYRK